MADSDPALDHGPVLAVVTALSSLLAARGKARGATSGARSGLVSTREGARVITALTDAGIPADVAAAVLALTLRTSPMPRTNRVHLARGDEDDEDVDDDTGDDPTDEDDDRRRGVVLPFRRRGGTRVTRRRTQVTNLTRRAQYLLNAGRRVADGTTERVADGAGRLDAIRDAIGEESSYWAAHVDAARNRDLAARAVDRAADRYGDLLGWQAELDDRTTPECRAADGKNFYVSDPPAIGAPGTVHGSCRCQAVEAWEAAGMVDDDSSGEIAASVPVRSAQDGPRITRSTMARTGSGNTSTSLDADSRRRDAARGHALPDGSFQINNRVDLRNAIHAYGRATPSKRPQVRAHIRRRARALGVQAPSLTGNGSSDLANDDSDSHQPPAGAVSNAKRAVELIADGKAGAGMTSVGRARARQLASGRDVDTATVRAMHAYFARHASGDQGRQNEAGTAANVAWLAWGGDAGKRWADSICARLDG